MGKQRLPTGCIESDMRRANIKNKADTGFEGWKTGAPEQGEVQCALSKTSRHTTHLIQKQEGPSYFRKQSKNTNDGKSGRGNHSRMKEME
jgi:hypothetical protein